LSSGSVVINGVDVVIIGGDVVINEQHVVKNCAHVVKVKTWNMIECPNPETTASSRIPPSKTSLATRNNFISFLRMNMIELSEFSEVLGVFSLRSDLCVYIS